MTVGIGLTPGLPNLPVSSGWHDLPPESPPGDQSDISPLGRPALGEGLPVGQQRTNHVGIELVAAAMRGDLTDEVRTGQRKVADDVQNLVTDAFVRETQRIVDWPVV